MRLLRRLGYFKTVSLSPRSLRRMAVYLLLPVMAALLWLHHAPQVSEPDSGFFLTVYQTENRASVRMSLEDYVLHATAAEMPANYAEEALKCQAVAARTRAVAQSRRMAGNGCKTHPDCDICTDSACCQGYLSDEALHERWGSTFSQLHARILRAVRDTEGLALFYEGMPIEMVYHACSGGRTEDSAAVFSASKPYLVSVESPGEEGYAGYIAETTFSCAEATALLLRAFPSCGVTAETLPSALRLQTSTASGRVSTLLLGDQTVTGVAFRQALGLRSTCFTWESSGDQITFRTVGYGHGVGLSQAGAQAMAAGGASFADILAHYYPGTQLANVE